MLLRKYWATHSGLRLSGQGSLSGSKRNAVVCLMCPARRPGGTFPSWSHSGTRRALVFSKNPQSPPFPPQLLCTRSAQCCSCLSSVSRAPKRIHLGRSFSPPWTISTRLRGTTEERMFMLDSFPGCNPSWGNAFLTNAMAQGMQTIWAQGEHRTSVCWETRPPSDQQSSVRHTALQQDPLFSPLQPLANQCKPPRRCAEGLRGTERIAWSLGERCRDLGQIRATSARACTLQNGVLRSVGSPGILPTGFAQASGGRTQI